MSVAPTSKHCCPNRRAATRSRTLAVGAGPFEVPLWDIASIHPSAWRSCLHLRPVQLPEGDDPDGSARQVQVAPQRLRSSRPGSTVQSHCNRANRQRGDDRCRNEQGDQWSEEQVRSDGLGDAGPPCEQDGQRTEATAYERSGGASRRRSDHGGKPDSHHDHADESDRASAVVPAALDGAALSRDLRQVPWDEQQPSAHGYARTH